MDEVMAPAAAPAARVGPLAAEREMLAQARKVTLFAAGAASQKYMQELADQQEIMGALADSIMEVFALESCLLRAEKIVAARGEAAARQAIALTRYYAARAAEIIQARARRVIAAVAEGDMLRTQMAILRRLGKYEPADTIAIGRQIAAQVIGAGRYGV